MGAYRFARRPRWLATHLLVIAVVVLFVNLGFWQLRRLDERRDRNELIEARTTAAAVPVGELVDPGDGDDVTDELRFRAVTATGRYDSGEPVTVRTTMNGAPGQWVFSALGLDGGEAVLVLRGFGPDVTPPAPPDGEVTVEGWAVPVDRIERPARTEVERRLDGDPTLLPVVVQAASSEPADDGTLRPVPLPELDEGPHLSYAVQWFLFASVVVVGYPFLLRREARRRA